MYSDGTILTVTIDEGIFRPTPFVGTYATSTDHLLHSGPRLLLISLRSPMPNCDKQKGKKKSWKFTFWLWQAMVIKRSVNEMKCFRDKMQNDALFTLCFSFFLFFFSSLLFFVLQASRICRKILNLIFSSSFIQFLFLFTLYVFIHIGGSYWLLAFFPLLAIVSPRTPHVFFLLFTLHSSAQKEKKNSFSQFPQWNFTLLIELMHLNRFHAQYYCLWLDLLLFNKQFSNLNRSLLPFSSLFLLPVGSLIASFWAYPVYFAASKPVTDTFNTMQPMLVCFVAWKNENRVFILIIIIFVVFFTHAPILKVGKFSQFWSEDDRAKVK